MQENTTPQFSNPRSELTSLSVRDLLYKYLRYLPLFILSISFALLGGYVYLRYSIPQYSSNGVLLIKDDKSKSNRGNDKFEELFSNSSVNNIQAEMELIKSKSLMRRVVDRLGLSVEYYGVGKVKSVSVYKRAPFYIIPIEIKDSLESISFDISIRSGENYQIDGLQGVYRFGQEFILPQGRFRLEKNQGGGVGSDYLVRWMPAELAASQYVSLIKVAPKSVGTGILNISITTENAQLSADIVNNLSAIYDEYSIEQMKASNDQILAFADDRLLDIGSRLDSVQDQYLDFQIRNNIIDPDAQLSAYFGKVDAADKAISEQQLKLNVVGLIDNYLSDKVNDFNKVIVPSSLGLEDATLNELVSAYNQAQLERKLLLDGNVPNSNAAVRQLEGQLEKMRLSIKENLRNIRSAYGSALSQIQSKERQGQAELSSMPSKIKELAELKRQVGTYQALYELFLNKREETAIARASTVSNITVVESALPNEDPVSPDRKTTQLIALLVGLGLPALFIFISELLNDKITSRFDIEKITQAPILGEIGHSLAEQMLVATKANRSMVAEQFRIIRSNLQYFLNKKTQATILVTSTFGGEGKTYVSSNVAAVHALTGKKTILLEFDIRKPKVLSGLDMDKGQGLIHFMAGKTDDIESLIRQVPGHENFFVIGCGPIPPNPSELLLEDRVTRLFEYLKSKFDFIVIDTAPVGMVSDAITLGKFADCTIYITRQNYSFKRQLALIDDYYTQSRLPHLSIVLNDVKAGTGYGSYGGYGYGYGYGQSYGYGSYFEDEKKPKGKLKVFKGWWKGLWG
jgi:capsular exopolysaccharide synthesis family protein